MTLTAAEVTGALEYGQTSDVITEITLQAINASIPDATTVSKWAEEYRFLSPERSARASIGLTKYTVEVTPYLREPMDCASDPSVRKITFIKSVQIGGTTFAENVIGYYMHADPAAILYVCEIEDKSKAFSSESLSPMIRDTPVLTGLVKDHRARDSNNTLKGKKFPGGHLAMGWATSAATLSSRPRRIVILDESDAYEPTKEGDPRDLAIARTKTFSDSKKIILISTPRNRLPSPPGSAADARRFSPIEFDYEQSDQRGLFLPCPQCGEFQMLEWERLNRDTGEFFCALHGCVIEEMHKPDMLAAFQWRAAKPFKGHAGFFIWEAYSPWASWQEIIEAYNEAERSGDLQKKKTFVNLSLARGWQDDDTPIETNDLLSRRENYYGTVPNGVLIITCGVDVQGNRLEAKVVGWGMNREKWMLDYVVIDGDPAFDDVWERLLNEVLAKDFVREDGLFMKIWCTAIDSGGHHTNRVYRFCRENSGRRVYATKGSSTAGQPLISKPTIKGRPPVMLFSGGSETAKDEIAAALRVKKPGPGYFHIPTEDQRFGDAYIKMLLSEHPEPNRAGIRRWVINKPGLRNEALDLMVLNYYALAIINPNFSTLAKLLARKHNEEREPGDGSQETGENNAETSKQVPSKDRPVSSTETADPSRGQLAASSEPDASVRIEEDPPSDSETPDSRPQTRKKKRRRRGNFATNWKRW